MTPSQQGLLAGELPKLVCRPLRELRARDSTETSDGSLYQYAARMRGERLRATSTCAAEGAHLGALHAALYESFALPDGDALASFHPVASGCLWVLCPPWRG